MISQQFAILSVATNQAIHYKYAIVYSDAKDASGLPGENYNPQAYTITKKTVTSKSTLKLRMAPCGGFAVSLREIK